jgi:hypothetical protein
MSNFITEGTKIKGKILYQNANIFVTQELKTE